MIRTAFALLLLAQPALAWEFKTGPICVLEDDGENAFVKLTYDPSGPLYSIAITPNQAWEASPLFGIQFDGPAALTITTDRHVLSDSNATVTVTDRGFGNVLNGLEFNETATAMLGRQLITMSLDGAAPEVQKFRQCAEGVGV
ncbi:MAG: hypothetical protein AAGG69_10515 [Pseudomonadota bacterium]